MRPSGKKCREGKRRPWHPNECSTCRCTATSSILIRPFARVLDGIFSGISQPDIAQLFGKLAASGTYQQFSSLVEQAQGSAGLMRFLQLDLDHALSIDPEAQDWTGAGWCA